MTEEQTMNDDTYITHIQHIHTAIDAVIQLVDDGYGNSATESFLGTLRELEYKLEYDH